MAICFTLAPTSLRMVLSPKRFPFNSIHKNNARLQVLQINLFYLFFAFQCALPIWHMAATPIDFEFPD
jgi:hypothetical protein